MECVADRRYARQTVLPEIGEEGQAKLAAAKVLAVGAGGLGCPALLYLTAAGVGTLGVVDHDRVELSNLQRQILFETSDIGRRKVESARDALLDLNPEIQVQAHPLRLTAENAAALFAPYDLILDGSDNIETRYAVNDACQALGKPLISAAIQGFQGHLYVFPFQTREQPCYRCLFPDPPPADAMPDCRSAGVVGALAGVMGAMQALEAVKYLCGIAPAAYFYRFNGLQNTWHAVNLARSASCAHPSHVAP